MEKFSVKFGAITRTCAPNVVSTLCTKIFKRDYTENIAVKESKNKIHPYKRLHPWRSLTEFSKNLLENVIYNQDGLVVLNKPYGISTERVKVKMFSHYIPHAVNYALGDALPYIAKELNYPRLFVVRQPEKYMTGVTILAANEDMIKRVEDATSRGNNFVKTYWMITTGVPTQLKGKAHLGMKLISDKRVAFRKPIIITSWSNNAFKRREVKIMNVEFKVLSNSTLNLCSLIEIRSSTNRWHALRLFAATQLYCPVLGDNLYATRISKVGNTYVQTDPFGDCENLINLPKLDKGIFSLLNLRSSEQYIIPAHLHLRSIHLPSFLGKKEDLTFEAPLIPPFDWTCQQLQFKCFTQNK